MGNSPKDGLRNGREAWDGQRRWRGGARPSRAAPEWTRAGVCRAICLMSYIRYDRPPTPAAMASTFLPDDTSDAAQGTPAFSPLYRQIKGLLLQSLQAGEWKPGEAIPSEMDLAARFRVSQGTVRKAIDELAADNLLVRRQGKGTFVATHAEQHVRYRFLKLMPDNPELAGEGPAQRAVVECKRARASAEVARALALRTGDPVVQVRRVLSFAGVPTILEDLWLPGNAFKGLNAEQMAGYHGPTYAMFEVEFGVRMVRAE